MGDVGGGGSAGGAHAGGDALDGEAEEVAKALFFEFVGGFVEFAAASQEFDLDEIQGIDIGVTGFDGFLEPGGGGEEFGAADDIEDGLAGAVPFAGDHGPDGSTLVRIGA